MSDRTVKVTLTANVDGYTAALKKATNTALSFNKTQQDLAAKAKQLTQQAEQAARADESQLQKLQRQAAEARKTSEEYNNAYQKMATGLTAVGGAMAGFAVGGMAAAVKGFAEFDAQMSNVAASTGATGTQLDQLRQAAMDAGAEFGQFTSTDAAGALEELGKAGLDTTQSIEALRGVMGLAAADNMEVGRAAEVTAQALTMFSREGVTATQVADALAQGAGAAVGSASELAEGLGNVGPVAASMGITMRDTVQTLALFAQNGIRGAEGGTQLKSMLLRLQNPTEQASKAMQKLGISAYDANGNFVGMRDIFAQLAKGAKDMSAEQRDAALATVFGSHAVLSANIAMREGVEGYDAMNEAMAEFGSAAGMAAKRTDNLAGDWKNFTGVMENVAIKMGEAANGPLRKLVQQLTDMAEWAGRNTGTVQVLLGITGALGGLALTAGGIMKATTVLAEFKTSLAALGKLEAASAKWNNVKTFFSDVKTGANGARTSLIGFTAATAAITGATIAIRAMKEEMDAADDAARVMSGDWVKKINKGAPDLEADLTYKLKTDAGSNFDRAVAATGDLNNLGYSLKRATDPQWTQDIENFLAIGDSFGEKVRKNIAELDKAFQYIDTSKAVDAFNRVNDAAEKEGISIQKVAELFPEYNKQLQAQAEQLGVVTLTAQDYAEWMGGKIPTAVAVAQLKLDQMTNGIPGVVAANKELAAGAEGSAEALQEQAKAVSDAVDDLTAYANAQLRLSGSEISVQESIDNLTETIKKNGKSLDITTKAGRENMEAVNSLASAHMANIEAMKNAGEQADVIAAKQAEMRAEFVKTAKQAGLNTDAIEELADTYYGVPKEVTTTVEALNVAQATKQLNEFMRAGDDVPDKVWTSVTAPGAKASTEEINWLRTELLKLPENERVNIFSEFDQGGITAARAALKELKDKTVNVTVAYRAVGTPQLSNRMMPSIQADGSVLSFYARGGVSERHIAQMAPAGAWRVWAEPETGGEAYIPLAASKRARSEAILAEVARRFGMRLEKYATGGISIPNITMPAPRTITATRTATPRTNYTPTSSPVIVETSSPTDVATAVKQALTGLTWIMDGKAIDVRLAEREQTAGLAMQWRGI